VNAASMLTNVVFVATVAAVAVLLSLALRRARVSRAVTFVVFLVMIVAPGALARAGVLDRYSPLPAPALVMVGVVTIFTVAIAFSSIGGRIVAAVPLVWLIGYQAFRIPVEWVLHRLYLEDVVPVQMTYAGRNFDIVTGLTAVALALFLRSGRRATALVLIWNLLGLALLANIVTIAVLSTPAPFRYFTDTPPHVLPSTFPFVWLPTFLVQAALFGHILVSRTLLAGFVQK